MIRVKMLRGNETAIIDNGKSYVFGLNGVCYSEDAGNLVSYMNGALDLPVISVLTSGGQMELGVSFPGQNQLRRYKSALDQMACVGELQMHRGFIKMLRRSGSVGTARFNQLLFVYQEDFDIMSLLSRLHVTEV